MTRRYWDEQDGRWIDCDAESIGSQAITRNHGWDQRGNYLTDCAVDVHASKEAGYKRKRNANDPRRCACTARIRPDKWRAGERICGNCRKKLAPAA